MYNPFLVKITYTGTDKALANSKVIVVKNQGHIKTLTRIISSKPIAKDFETVASKARQFLAPFVKSAGGIKGLLSDMQVRIISNPLLQDGKDRPKDRFTEYQFSLSAILAMTNLSVQVVQRPTWTRNTTEADIIEQDYLAELSS